jgi:hypothetical protein
VHTEIFNEAVVVVGRCLQILGEQAEVSVI